MLAWVLVVHVFGIILWVSGLLATTILLHRHVKEDSAPVRLTLARMERIFLRGLADPGALLTIAAGITVIALNSSYYLHARWLYIKLFFVAFLLVLHWVIGSRVKSIARTGDLYPRRDATLLLGAVVLVVLLILIFTLPGEVILT